MKKKIQTAAALLGIVLFSAITSITFVNAAFAQASTLAQPNVNVTGSLVTPAIPHGVTPPAIDPIAELTKQRDAAIASAQQQQIATEYYKAIAERNEALLRVNAVQTELDQTKQLLIAASKRADDLQKENIEEHVKYKTLLDTKPATPAK